jgi:hypothetical protein
MKIWGNNFLSQHILPGRYAAFVEKQIKETSNQIDSANNFSIAEGSKDDLTQQLTKNIEDQQVRKMGLEDKVKSILFGITVSITAITFSLNYQQIFVVSVVSILTLIALSFSIFYFVSSAIVAVKTLIPVGFSSFQINVEFDKDKQEIKLVPPDADIRLHQLLKDKMINDNVNLCIANATYASLKLIRNGIILFGVYFVLAFLQKISKDNPAPLINLKGAIQTKINDSSQVIIHYQYNNEHQVELFTDSISTHTIRSKPKTNNPGNR